MATRSTEVPPPATIESGQSPVAVDWGYLNAPHPKKLPSWEVFVPQGAVLGGYYFRAINSGAPHPATDGCLAMALFKCWSNTGRCATIYIFCCM